MYSIFETKIFSKLDLLLLILLLYKDLESMSLKHIQAELFNLYNLLLYNFLNNMVIEFMCVSRQQFLEYT